ncbi:MAG: hypothetical protein GWO39_09990, partial [Gammaproteobacteria bacterium]|nr:hypothetical protein [Gammaproteobacteria bacterium]NIT64091.1 hypothetical protein [Gammaproteobacteria bacterium]NIV21022.1 hypothetical protein [Gammaproteobacteria bacterium]NIY32671.1 hypothetical protein [Gammaproteobacteria bacterium]
MTDNKIGPHIGNIRPVTEPRPADTPSRKEQTGGADFRKVLESTVNQMQQVTDKSPAQEGQGKASAVKAEAAQAAADV